MRLATKELRGAMRYRAGDYEETEAIIKAQSETLAAIARAFGG